MIPSLGEKYNVEIEAISKPRTEFQKAAYLSSGLPAAPAIMVGGELVVQGRDIEEAKLETIICRHLGLSG